MLIVTVFMRTVPAYATVSSDGVHSIYVSPMQEGEPAQTVDGLVLNSPLAILNASFVVSLVVLAVLIAAGAAVAWVISGKMLEPLQAINRAAKLASTGSLDHRVGLRGPKDELHDLSDTFDLMLGRLDDAFESHKRFAANASHELRTPLAATETMLEVALSDPDISVNELRFVADRVLETNRRNAQTVEALLALAQVGAHPVDPQPVDLEWVVQDSVAAVAEEAEAMGVDVISVLRDCTIVGDEVLLRQALTNLLTNAVRHNEEGGLVEVTLTRGRDEAHLRIENTGAMLTSARIEQLREPFARGTGRVAGNGSRTRGHGLGLAIATTAIEGQGGTLDLTPRHGGGLVAHVTLPDTPFR
ncbi:sensor histidine kinase [Microbacterium oxydans]|uniref:sensor histidine kinase n=1 Tax=Microbacterium oxydans TaxID=82380 RepID=UPI00226B811B|nr:ATP-binding protein [Microbacterium oxydans]WAA65648.1 ATP-binding protein [Microbacterium oxydans]